MKRFTFKILSYLLLIISAIWFQSCNDEMNDHYKNESLKAINGRLTNYIQADTTLSKFYQMLTLTGYDTILSQSQTFTVWAPDNNALQNVDTSNKTLVFDIVRNHIARFSFSSSGVLADTIRMVNGKRFVFVHNGSDFIIGNAAIHHPGTLTGNGIVYSLKNYLPFQSNIWEFIQRTLSLDSLRNYINEQYRPVFRPELSIEIGSDSKNNKIYDSVFVVSNLLFKDLGQLDSEDSIYTVILPDNTAWNEAYNRIKSYFVSSDPKNAAAIQRAFTKSAIVHNLSFRGRISSPNTADSLISSVGNIFYHPGYLFANSSAQEVSNGLVYLTNQMQYKDTTWFKEIRVEAEQSTGRTPGPANIYLLNSYGSSWNVSKKSYIKVEPTSTSSKPYVQFPIPGTLSAKYNLYCVFVPPSVANIADTIDKRPFRPSFYLITYGSDKTKPPIKTQVFPVSSTIPGIINKKLVASNISFPSCDYSLDEIPVTHIELRVYSEVYTKPADNAMYNSTMRIDCIILEPVAQ